MKRLLAYCLCLTAFGSALALRAPIIANLQIDQFAISPNGDGIADSMNITYALSDTATSVFLFVLSKDSTTVVDTLVPGVAQLPGTTQVAWHGTLFDGSPAPEDSYLVFLRTENVTDVDSTYRTVTVDVTIPTVTITNLFPNPFAPGSAAVGQSQLNVAYDLNDPAPSANLAVRVRIFDPSGTALVTIADDSVQAAISSHIVTWNGDEGGSIEGDYEIKIEATDQAGNARETYSSFVVDRTPPDVKFTTPQPGGRFAVVPDSLFGLVWDSVAILELNVRYDTANPYVAVPGTFLVNDTLHFAVPLADSIVTEGSHTVHLQAISVTQRETIEPFSIILDTTAPTTPTLLQPPSPTQFPVIQLDGTVPSGTELVRFLRSGTVIDSAFNSPPASEVFPHSLALIPGSNRITAIAVDNTGNASAPSNEVTIVFEDVAKLTINQPFTPDDVFQVNLTKTSSTITLRIYDLAGQLVNSLQSATQSTSVAIPWDGKNGDFETVKRGPLVAVAFVDYLGGGSETFKEIFLFQP